MTSLPPKGNASTIPIEKNLLLSEFNGNSPNNIAAIRQFEADAKIVLPPSYVEFLLQANGGEGFIGPNAYVIFWRLSELIIRNKDYEISKYTPGLFLFGSDGGGEAFAFDMRSMDTPIVQVPFVGIDVESIERMGSNFDEFLHTLFKS